MAKTQHYDRLIVKDLIKIDVLSILSDPHPSKIEDYAIRMFYLANGHRFFTCSDAKPLGENSEKVRLFVEGDVFIVNVRNGKIDKIIID